MRLFLLTPQAAWRIAGGAALCAAPWLGWGALPSAWSCIAFFTAAMAAGLEHFFPGRLARLGWAGAWAWAGICVFLAAAAQPLGWVAAGVAVVGLASGLWPLPRAQSVGYAVATVAVAASMAAVVVTLYRAGWVEEAATLGTLVCGLGCGLGFVLHGVQLVRLQVRPPQLSVGLFSLAALAAWRGVVGDPTPPAALPAWRRSVAALPRAVDLDTPGPGVLGALLRLQAVGAQDGAHALVAYALAGNGAPDALRPLCPRGAWRGPLPSAWAPVVARGAAACASLTPPLAEAGAQLLDTTADPALMRLRADLWAEAGDMAAAAAAYRQATAAGDRYAAADADAASTLRGSSRSAPPGCDTVDDLAVWAHYNAGMDLDDWGIGPHRGLVGIDAPGRFGALYLPDLQRMVLATQSLYGGDFGVRLPLPPVAPWPASLVLQIRGSPSLRVEVSHDFGHTQVFDCTTQVPWAEHAPTAISAWPLPPAACRSQWAKVVLPLRPAPVGAQIARLSVHGDFWLATVRVVPARRTAHDQSADTGGDLRPTTAVP